MTRGEHGNFGMGQTARQSERGTELLSHCAQDSEKITKSQQRAGSSLRKKNEFWLLLVEYHFERRISFGRQKTRAALQLNGFNVFGK
jgi:hypothetical protein